MSFLPRIYGVIAIAIGVIAFAPEKASVLGQAFLWIALAVSSVVTVTTGLAVSRRDDADLVYAVSRASYVDHAVVAFGAMAVGCTELAWAWVVVALARSAVIFICQERAERLI